MVITKEVGIAILVLAAILYLVIAGTWGYECYLRYQEICREEDEADERRKEKRNERIHQ